MSARDFDRSKRNVPFASQASAHRCSRPSRVGFSGTFTTGQSRRGAYAGPVGIGEHEPSAGEILARVDKALEDRYPTRMVPDLDRIV